MWSQVCVFKKPTCPATVLGSQHNSVVLCGLSTALSDNLWSHDLASGPPTALLTSASNVSGFGMSQKVGHLDFYPNGGKQMPGCQKNILSTIIDINGLWEGTYIRKAGQQVLYSGRMRGLALAVPSSPHLRGAHSAPGIFRSVPCDRSSAYPHFTDEETGSEKL